MININNDCLDPYFNLALEEYFLKNDDDESYFTLWQNYNTIVVGKYQNPLAEINREFVNANKIKVSRRLTGGGAVFHDLGNINFTFITPNNGAIEKLNFKKFTDPIIGALASIGVTAKSQGRNDLVIDGKKISGNSQYMTNKKVLHHGTLLFDSDLEKICDCLVPDQGKFDSNHVPSIKSRVTNIAHHLPAGKDLDVYSFGNLLLDFMIKEYGIKTSRPLTADETSKISRLRDEKYATWDWVYGSSPDYNYEKSKKYEGVGTISFKAAVSEGRIENCRIYGDFFGSGDLSEVEKTIAGVRLRYDDLNTALFSIDIKHFISNCDKEQLLSLILN